MLNLGLGVGRAQRLGLRLERIRFGSEVVEDRGWRWEERRRGRLDVGRRDGEVGRLSLSLGDDGVRFGHFAPSVGVLIRSVVKLLEDLLLLLLLLVVRC